jgi:phage tail sheath gpL-like
MAISEIIRKPGSYTEITVGPSGGLPSKRQELLIIAPRLDSGRVAAIMPTQVFSASQAAEAWGAGSVMHRMALAAFRQYGQVMLTGCAVDDAAAGVAASASVTFDGTATATGSVSIWIGTDRVTVRVEKDSTADQVAARIASEIKMNFPAAPVYASALIGGETVTLTAKNKGTTGNHLGQKGRPAVSVDVAGITATATAYTGGANDPDIRDALAAVAGQRYHLIAIPWTTQETAAALSEHLTEVSNEINQLGGRGVMFIDGTHAEAYSFAQTINDKRMMVGWIYGAKRPQFENAAAFAAMQAAVDAPWRATNNVELIGCDAPPIPDRANWNEINGLLWQGIAAFNVGDAGRVQCVRAISTYIKNDSGAEDDTFLDSFKIATADYVRDAVRVRHLSDFPNKILRDNHVDGEPSGVVTPADVRDTNLDVCRRIEREGGLNNVNFFADGFTSVRDPNVPGRVNSVIPIDIVDAAHIMANTITITSTL